MPASGGRYADGGRRVRLETFERLLTPEGRALVDEVRRRAGVESDLALGTRLRRTHDGELVAAAVTQSHLRGVARTKLGDDAEAMFLTHDALQQATRSRVAAHRARRLADGGVGSVVDLGCGVGADLVAFARAGLTVHGVDLDPVRAAMAAANLEALGLEGTVATGDATAVDLTAWGSAFCDPARRDGRGRVFDPRAFSPDWDFVTRLLDGAAAVKTMPGIDHDLVPDGVEAEWVGDGGDLVEACLWGRPLATAARRVTLLPAGATLTDAELPDEVDQGGPGGYLYEPDDAVGRAGLVGAVAGLVDGWLLDPHLAYVTSDRLVPTPFARAFRVLEELPFRTKALRAALRERDVGTLTIKKRGVEVVPERLVRTLGLTGSVPATVVMTRVAGQGVALLVDPVPSGPDGTGTAGTRSA
ncbi:THUMP-like domain-containing protein [Solicola sp. PLA-1-18]|uniref:class I SAM-dependent methyltransferase n=1 Tax=Solicola sp. PLA-1-18 TaxID=3380532 RepID=UPI003B7F6C90